MANLSANVTNKTIADFYRECLPHHRELQAAQDVVRSITGRLRAVYKRAKEAGVNEKAIARLLKERLQDPDEVTKELHDYVRARALIGAMPTEQMEMFVDLLRTESDEETAESLTRERVWDDGYFEGNQGHNRDTNPHVAGSDHFDTWDRGWIAGQEKIVAGMAPKTKGKRGRPPKPRAGKLDPASEMPAEQPAEELPAAAE